jgi:lipid II:glycine glycyltransferase (peptidoglycan interpeptide bridge formation enzyme)
MTRYEFRELSETEDFDPNVITPGVPFTQAAFYGTWQKALGRKVRRFVVGENGHIVAYYQLVKFPLLRGKAYLYAPYGPVVKNSTPEFLDSLKKELQRMAKEERAVFVRLDFTPPPPPEALVPFFTKAAPYTYHSAYFQPRVEWYLDLGKREDELFTGMHEKTQYSIRTGEKRGVSVEVVTSDFGKYFETFFELMTVTAARNNFHLHEKKYYKSIFATLPTIANSYLVVARYGPAVLVIDLFIVSGGVANHVFGCSSSEERTRMPNYLAQWEAIRHAKNIRCTAYNFGGIETEEYRHKGWEGLTRFKKRFGGREVRHSEFFDLVMSPFWYRLYNLRKRLKSGF